MSHACSVLLASFLFFATQVIGQTKTELQELNNLDSIAFAALEKGLPDVEQKAEELLESSQEYQSNLHLINANTLLGIVNKNKGYYVTAVDFYNQALKVAEEAKDNGRISACYNNIGSVYQIQENYAKALYYFQKSLNIEEKLNNPLQKSIRLYNIGDMYREMDSLTMALTNFNSSLLIEKEHQNREGIVYALLGVVDIYLKLDKPADASISLDEVKGYISEADVEIKILYNMLSADLLGSKGEYDQALSMLNESKAISNKYEYRIHLVDIYEKEIELKEAQETFDKSAKKTQAIDTSSSASLIIWIPIALVLLIAIVVITKRLKKRKSELADGSIEENVDLAPIFQLENEKGKILLKIAMNQIISFEANDNYVITHYLSEDDNFQKSMERASLKKIEVLLSGNPTFHRVHKSHIVNENHVKSIAGKAQSYKIEMNHLETAIPVSRSFDIKQISQ
jgi:tetratricopeptide (TPR) repeat protein